MGVDGGVWRGVEKCGEVWTLAQRGVVGVWRQRGVDGCAGLFWGVDSVRGVKRFGGV